MEVFWYYVCGVCFQITLQVVMDAITIMSDDDDDNINKLHLQFIGLYTFYTIKLRQTLFFRMMFSPTLFRNVLMTN